MQPPLLLTQQHCIYNYGYTAALYWYLAHPEICGVEFKLNNNYYGYINWYFMVNVVIPAFKGDNQMLSELMTEIKMKFFNLPKIDWLRLKKQL